MLPKILFITEMPMSLGIEVDEWIKEPAFREAGFPLVSFPYQYVSKRVGRVRMNQQLIDKAIQLKPDIIHMEKCCSVSSNTIAAIREKLPRATFTMWYGDMRGTDYIEQWLVNRLPYIDVLMLTASDKKLFKLYEDQWKYSDISGRIVCEWQLGVDREYHWMTTERVDVEYDVHFGGCNYKHRFPESQNRIGLLQRVGSKFNLHVQGGGWQDVKFLDNVGGRLLDSDVYPRVIGKSLLTLGINAYCDIANYYDRRTLQCIGAGRFHITKYVKDMERDFERGIHLDWFDSIDEAIDLISFYLKTPSTTMAMAQKASEWAHKNHNWKKKCLQYKDIVIPIVEHKLQTGRK